MDSSSERITTEIWSNLCAWIRSQPGGQVHPGLELRQLSDQNRSIFATSSIAVGETLIQLPRSLAVDGSHLPDSYEPTSLGGEAQRERRHVSPWLRCLAAYYQTRQQALQEKPNNKQCYLASLPQKYETVSISWLKDEIDSFLAGTSTQGGVTSWHQDESVVKDRYLNQIRPYLVHCGIFEQHDTMIDGGADSMNDDNSMSDGTKLNEEIDEFLKASQCLSTRCFHLQSDQSDEPSQSDDASSYTGPYLLPWIDLLNHSVSQKCTTLQSNNDHFFMIAERPLKSGQEIYHSYGDSLSAGQFLQTFGFMERDILEGWADPDQGRRSALMVSSPVLMAKQDILKACWDVIESDFPRRLTQAMEQAEMEDEVWTVKIDRSRSTDFLPDQILIDQKPHQQQGQSSSGGENSYDSTENLMISDELVTLACLPFLPICAYREAARSLLGPEILEDFFLGHLVCKSLLQAIHSRLKVYKPIVWDGVERPNDQQLLEELLTISSSVKGERAMYGIALRLEEKATLRAFQKELVQILADLEDEECRVEGIHDFTESENATKKLRMS